MQAIPALIKTKGGQSNGNRGVVTNRAYKSFFECILPYSVLMGGGGSGKSVAAAQKLILRCRNEHKTVNPVTGKIDDYTFSHRFLVVRKVAATRRESVYRLIKGLIYSMGMGKEWRCYEGDLRFLHLKTGAEIITVGIDDPEKIKSIYNISGIWIEEATELNSADFDQLDIRLRGEYPYYKQIVVTFNPISKAHWLYKYFEKKNGPFAKKSKTLFLRTTYKHNHFTTADYKKKLENLVNVDENLHRIYALGLWGIEDPNKLFAKNFRGRDIPNSHVSESAEYDPHLGTVWLSFDFNIINTCLVFQYTEDYIYQIAEYRHESGDLQDLVYEVRSDLRKWKIEALQISENQYVEDVIIVNADASGGNKSATSIDRTSALEQLSQFLGDRYGTALDWEYFNVPKSNPGHVSSRLVCNMILKNETNFKINPRCENTIEDLETVKILNGKIDKSDEDEGRVHCLDAWRYFVNAELKDRIQNYGLPKDVFEKALNNDFNTIQN